MITVPHCLRSNVLITSAREGIVTALNVLESACIRFMEQSKWIDMEGGRSRKE